MRATPRNSSKNKCLWKKSILKGHFIFVFLNFLYLLMFFIYFVKYQYIEVFRTLNVKVVLGQWYSGLKEEAKVSFLGSSHNSNLFIDWASGLGLHWFLSFKNKFLKFNLVEINWGISCDFVIPYLNYLGIKSVRLLSW